MRHKFLVLVAVLALLAAACSSGDDGGTTETTAGGDDGGTTTETTAGGDDGGTTETTAPADSGGGGGETPPVTDMGSFVVDGTEFAVTFLNRCIPFDGEDSEQIDLQPVAQGQGAILFLYGTADSVEVSVDGLKIEEIGGSRAFTATPFGDDGEIRASAINGDRWTGDATLADAFGTGSTVDVTWDVRIPDEIRDCSL